ncbi:hypothetical protein [Lederbergia ruris]|uniref:Uncharacterized protein n=1 Tax=Lederbergia ruris TaxID=217495 RepID=A0ABQ4KHC8_9BACI|nr:hypothetical protein [Lederbergia ruris]GIN56851.1 hypothetical protein J8TS2_11700 [Lederbergia ruris]
MQEYGPEGKRWRKAEEGELDYNGNQAKYTQLPGETTQTHNDGWEQLGPSLRTFEYRASFTAPEDPLAEDLAQFVTGDKDFEKDWDAYLKGFEGLQLDRYLEIYQESYDR